MSPKWQFLATHAANGYSWPSYEVTWLIAVVMPFHVEIDGYFHR